IVTLRPEDHDVLEPRSNGLSVAGARPKDRALGRVERSDGEGVCRRRGHPRRLDDRFDVAVRSNDQLDDDLHFTAVSFLRVRRAYRKKGLTRYNLRPGSSATQQQRPGHHREEPGLAPGSHRATTMPHGSEPTLMLAMTLPAATSITAT